VEATNSQAGLIASELSNGAVAVVAAVADAFVVDTSLSTLPNEVPESTARRIFGALAQFSSWAFAIFLHRFPLHPLLPRILRFSS